jgi:hypothetical protein
VTLRTRLIGLIVFAFVLVAGAYFSALAAAAALLSALVLAAASWFMRSSRWLRAVWYAGLLIGAGILYFYYPTAAVGGPVSSCEEMPALRVAPDEPRARNASTTPQHEEQRPGLDRSIEGLEFETSHTVKLESNQVSYRERVDLHLSRGSFVSLDLTALGLQLAPLRPRAQIIIGGDNMGAETFSPDELAAVIRLPMRPGSIWIESVMSVPPGAVPACRGTTLAPFQRVRLEWPHRLGTPIRGLARLPSSDESVPFSATINKKETRLSEVLLPSHSFFMQEPRLLKPADIKREGGIVFERFVPARDGVNIAEFAMLAELLPDNRIVRRQWVYAKRDLLFPVNWSLALLYVAIASAVGEVFLKRRNPV